MGNFRTASQEVGEGMWDVKYTKPEFWFVDSEAFPPWQAWPHTTARLSRLG